MPLGKPTDTTDALAVLTRLAGRDHQVLSAVVVVDADGIEHTALARAVVTMAPVGEAELAWYVATGEPMDKAGAYGIQGRAGAFVAHLSGSYSGVMGLPLYETKQLLKKFL